MLYLTAILPVNLTTKEEQLLLAFQDIGPMIAVAKPGRRIHRLGSVRMELTDDEWKREVRQLMQKAKLVVIRAGGDTKGLKWEMEEIFNLGLGRSPRTAPRNSITKTSPISKPTLPMTNFISWTAKG